MRKLFGTDGIRAVAGESPLDAATIFAVGLALAHQITRNGSPRRVLLGMDTRESSPWIAGVLTAGLREGGIAVENAGAITTPAVAHLARKHGFAAGVVISASHNPWQDNGIKIFGDDGYKLPDTVELAMEEEIFRRLELQKYPDPAQCPAPEVKSGYRGEYEAFLREAVPGLSLQGLHVVLDCANGAASAIAPELFAGLGGKVDLTHARPDGRNINAECGALHPKVVAAETKAAGADIGVTFDGDADRVLFADAHGNVVNGDAILLLAARDLKARKQLPGDVVVATTMSNMGLEAALKRNGIRMERAPVGDKYVLERMRSEKAALGGEQSGHILFPALATTGDGLLTALLVLEMVQRSGKPLHELVADLKVFPQVIVNVKVREKKPLEEIAAVAETIREAESDLDGRGRVVVRYSGTEALARVMIEAESEALMQKHAESIAGAIREAIGI
ncbi:MULTISPECIES: phosphoglucosamine mutase [Acidobacterium]|uniref:Phosphoglucosamine mutase n=1 Tax=Acidobacterium capsulatum (strain ATCC 51196 / DSM 11244 / BCRC 80197 / JCM 7670 / NBRC 15755 / NCIMB 13165 / 161) TaxID=240015 RepID=C1F7K6_ACIC5|nr:MULTISPECIES: phosphoglucosamine mutase [Acidobacterium]ACO31845.1 phosphoglucosamine mutase [Acidobacterium capsulatum ATCC 51196]HCT59627.1 phosphoglucosamine mutase [Acidobacterium sp.]